MIKNIDALTDKIYQEGIEKAQREASEILHQAKTEAENIIKSARKQAEEIRIKAEKNAVELRQKSLTDIQLAGKKSILSFKQEIKHLLKSRILDEKIRDSFSDLEFLKNLILEVVRNSSANIDKIVLPLKLKNKAYDAFINSLGKELPQISLDFDKRIEGGFQISEAKTGYMITFTDKDFASFFSPILNEVTESILFNPKNE